MEELIYKLEFKVKQSRDLGLISHFHEQYNLPVNKDLVEEPKNKILDPKFIELYSISDGLNIEWSSIIENEKVKGQMKVLALDYVLQDWENKLYDEAAITGDDAIIYFKPFDLISPEAQCGIIHKDNFKDEEIYLNFSKEPILYGLDLDFEGYMQMALEAGIFQYWPKVLIDIQNGEESFESSLFTRCMPIIFPEFNFSKFKEKYESMRLSNRVE